MHISKSCIQILLRDQLPSWALRNTEPGFSGQLPGCMWEREWFTLVHQEDDLCAPIRLWQRGLPCLGLFSVYQQALFTHILADTASRVALGYQTIKEWDYNGGGPLEEKAKTDREGNLCGKGAVCCSWTDGSLACFFHLQTPIFASPPQGQGITQKWVGGTAVDAYTRLPRLPTTLSYSSVQAALSTPLLLLGWQPQRVHATGCS